MPANNREEPPKPLRVLYVDDDHMHALKVGRRLDEKLGGKTKTVHVQGLHDALKFLKENPVDLLISDISVDVAGHHDPKYFEKRIELGGRNEIFESGLEFLAYAHQKFGAYPLAITGAEDKNIPSAGFILVRKSQKRGLKIEQDAENISLHIGQLLKNWGRMKQIKVNIEELDNSAPILHPTGPSKKKSLVFLTKTARENAEKALKNLGNEQALTEAENAMLYLQNAIRQG